MNRGLKLAMALFAFALITSQCETASAQVTSYTLGQFEVTGYGLTDVEALDHAQTQIDMHAATVIAGLGENETFAGTIEHYSFAAESDSWVIGYSFVIAVANPPGPPNGPPGGSF